MEISFGRLGGAPVGRRRNRREAGRRKAAGRAWVLARLQEMDFLKYSGKAISGGRNRPRFAIQAHCGLLVTSMSPNCCLLNGTLRKSHFPSQCNGNPCPVCSVPPPPGIPRAARSCPAMRQPRCLLSLWPPSSWRLSKLFSAIVSNFPLTNSA